MARVNTRRDQILPPAPGTCEWLYSHPAFGFWEAEGGVLWIRGKPGSGKSTLVKRIVAGVQPQMSSVVTGAWFYSVKLESTQRSHHVLMKTLLHSFLCRDPEDFYKHIDLYRKIRTPEATLWTQHDLEMFLRRISTSPRDTSLIAVIDALDESEDGAESEVSRDHLTAFLLDLACHQQSRLRLIVTSRPYRSFTEAFRNCEQIVLEQVTKDDIATVVDRGLSWLRNSLDREQGQSGSFVAVDSPTQQRRRSRRQDRLKAIRTGPQPTTVFMTFLDDEFKSMREFLLANANGVFLWTTLVLRELERISKTPLFNVQDLKKILFSLPAELEDLYSMILARLVSGSDGLHKTRRILAWTIGTDQSRPLTLSMLFDAIGINENLDLDEYLDSKTDPFLPHKPVYGCNTWGRFAFDVYEQCGGLIDILPAAENWKPFQEYLEGEIDDEWVVTLLHKTALDYLATSKCPASLRMTESQAETIVNNGLMAYLQVYLPIKPRENSFHPRALTVHEKNIQDTSEPEDRMLYSLEDDKITYDVLGYGQTIKQHFSLEQAPNNQDGTEPLLNGVGLWLETLDPRSLDSDYEYRLHTRYFATKLSETVAKCKDRLFASPDLELLTYLQERQLLCFALDILPLQWEMNHEEGIQKYRCLETLNKAASETSPIWLSWLQSIPGSAFLAICEYNFDTALEIIQCLLAFNKESLSRAARAIPGAIMLFCSQHGPEKYVPGATQAFFSELRSECNLNSIDLSLVYEMSLMCNERGYSNLGWYLAWRWSEHISEDRLLSQSMKCDLELEGIYRGLGGIADVPQFSLHINSMDNPEQYTTWVDVHAMAESLGVLKDVEDESAFVPRPLASLAPDSSSERPPGTKSCGAIDLMPRRFSMSSLVNISTFKRCHSWTYRIPASPFSRVSDYSGSCDEPVPSCLHDQAEGKKPRLWSLLTDQVGQHQRLQHHTSII